MTPALIGAIISLVEEGITLYPTLAQEFQSIFNSGSDTATILSNLAALRTKVASGTYLSFVPATALTPAQQSGQ